MKKIMIALVAVGVVCLAKAASVDWTYTGVAANNGYSLYLFTTAVSDSYESFNALIAGAIDNGTVVKKTVGPKTSYTMASRTASNASIDASATLYYVLIADSKAETYKYGSVAASALVYDPGAQQTSPGALMLNNASFTSTGTISSVPEPTSGLLLLVGMAGLALRRKQK